MSKPIKAMVAAELQDRYGGTRSACVVDLTGMNVQQQDRLRRQLRANSARLEVVKNSLARRAFRETPLAPLGDALEGPCALVTSAASLIEVAKVLVEASKEFTELKLKQAIFDGEARLLTIQELSKMRGRRELLGELAMLVTSPARRLAGCLRSPQARIAGCLQTMIDRGG